MSIVSGRQLLLSSAAAAAATGISRSLRFNSSDSAYLSRTPASAGNRKTWTWAGWVKRSKLSTLQYILQAYGGGSYRGSLFFDTDDKLYFYLGNTSAAIYTIAVFRDVSAWYHIALKIDTTQATQSTGMKLYVNGVEQTVTNSGTYTQNDEGWINSTNAHQISGTSSYYFDGLLADCYLIDGQALTPSSFTETDATTGQLIPKAYTGSYGTNGFRLTFSDNSGTTSTTLGKDSAGSNNWTPNNFSVSSGAGNDSLVDVPTSSGTDNGNGGEVRGNYCVLNPLQLGANITLSNGNLDGSQPSGTGTNTGVTGTIGLSSGKWYWETTVNTRPSGTYTAIGIASSSWRKENNLTTSDPVWIYYGAGSKSSSSGEVSYGATYTTGDVVGVAFDADNGTLTFYKNGASQGQAFTGLTSGPYFPLVGKNEGACSWTWSVNFGARPFQTAAPAGFRSLNTANLPAPLVTKPSTVMDVVLYTGTGSSLTLPYASSTPTSIAFTPDLVWIKGRSGATDHALYDAVRDVQKDLASNSTAAETTQSTGLTAFGTNTFTIGSLAKLNTSSATYAAWCWDAGTTTVTNTQGSITSSVRANATAGMSIVGAPISSSGGSIGHGLNVSPGLIIVKNRGTSGTNWVAWHSSLGTNDYLLLNSTDAKATSANLFNGVSSSTFTVGSGFAASTLDFICYCFAPVVGYSSFGSYTANASSDGPMVWLGFKPKLILIKAASDAGDMTYASWLMLDTSRDTYNICTASLYANKSQGEGLRGNGTSSGTYLDILSNGFKIRYNGSEVNGVNGQTYIYCAWAESPFNYARAR